MIAGGTAAMVLPAPYLFGTPFYQWPIFVGLFIGGMYAVAFVPAYFHYLRSRRG
jgi:hypothetical protein